MIELERVMSVDPERFSATARFLRSAVSAGAHFKPPVGFTYPDWERDLNITFTTYFGKHSEVESVNGQMFSGHDLGEMFPGENGALTRARISQITSKIVKDLWDNCQKYSPEVCNEFELKQITKKTKPIFLTFADGTTRSILLDVESGVSSEDLYKKYSTGCLQTARYALDPYGIYVPFSEGLEKRLSFEAELEGIGPKTDTQTMRHILDRLNNNYRSSCRNLS